MIRYRLHFSAVLISFLSLIATGFAVLRWPDSIPQSATNSSREFSRERLAARFARLPLQFEKNQGQVDGQVKFMARGPGYSLFLTASEAVLVLEEMQKTGVRSEKTEEKQVPRRGVYPEQSRRTPRDDIRYGGSSSSEGARTRAVVRMKLAGTNENPAVAGKDELPGRSNYLLGNDRSQWRSGVQSYSKVEYADVYPGIDLVYYGNPQQLEYDFIVAPGASPHAIQIDFSGADGLRLDAAGDLIVSLSDPSEADPPVRMRRPVIYQETHGQRREISGRYTLRGERRVGFEVAAYDPQLPLVIDPVLNYSTYLGGSGWEEVYGIGVDATGNVYVTGFTTSPDFPLASPFRATKSTAEDVFISKVSADGSQLIYSTYLGGNDTDDARGLTVDSTGRVTVAGYTYSTNFPVMSAFQNNRSGTNTADGFVARLNESGSALVYSTYLGGSGDDLILGLASGADGSAYVTGQTTSSNFPTTASGFQRSRASTRDGFVTKLSPAGNTLAYSSYLGGNSDFEEAQAVAVDGGGNAFVTGFTLSTNFPVVNAFQGSRAAGVCVDQGFLVPCYDVFVTKVSASGSQLIYSTYLGGDGDDIGNRIAVDSEGSAYVAGQTISTNFPTANPVQAAWGGLEDGFLTKLSPNGASLAYSTYLGGQLTDTADAVAVNDLREAYVTGGTDSNDFPILNSIQPLNGFNAYVLKMSTAGNALLYSTYLGGSGGEKGYAVAADSSGSVFIGGATASTDFPLTNPFQSIFTQAACISGNLIITCPEGFLAKLSLRPALYPGGVVNGASFAPNSAVAAGGIVSAFGTDLATSLAFASEIPLPNILANLSVRMDGILAPLYFVAGGQINLQVPWELAGQSQATVAVSSASAVIAPITVNLASAAPGIFTTNSSGAGQGAILNSSSGEFAAPVGSIPGAATRPANRGDFVTIYCTGLGPVTNRPGTGLASPGGPNLAVAITTPVVTIGGIQANVDFAGLSPNYVGLYQINAQVPANAQVGSVVPVAVSVGGVASNTVQMAIQ
ncbi:MAG: SBBP repeat-containing protein [Acidobacteria bacterium]|nr:SBBP repeat-containing protein [Acidobacteriota bacterium]